MEIVSGIHQLKVPIPNNPLEHLNCYLIEGKDGWLMIDTGWYTAEVFDFLQTELRNIGLTLTDVSTIVITHVHPDHFGLAGRIKQVSPRTQLLIHRWESDLIESRYVKFSELRDIMSTLLQRHGVPPLNLSALESASLPALEFVMVTFPDHVLYGGENISTGHYDLEVIRTPGHSPGHICLYQPTHQLLFSGDHILPSITSNISYHVQSGDNPLGDYINALHKLENLPVAWVLPAHEDAFSDLRSRIDQIIIHHNKRKDEIQKVIANEPYNAWEISPQITWDTSTPWDQLPPLHKRFAVTEVIAHLESMRWEGKVRRIVKDNSVSYVAH
ncbi:MAG: MBL fold metallo-hydrolase [Candidatus Thorarchaeota archaeon]|jgi:glyoxylase-like metal-dependent hydrolase (beta-lactamase superfamily II)